MLDILRFSSFKKPSASTIINNWVYHYGEEQSDTITAQLYFYEHNYNLNDFRTICITPIDNNYQTVGTDLPRGIVIKYINSTSGDTKIVQGRYHYGLMENDLYSNSYRSSSYLVDLFFNEEYEDLLKEYDQFNIGLVYRAVMDTPKQLYAVMITDGLSWSYDITGHTNNGVVYNEAYFRTWKYLKADYKKREGLFSSKLYYTVYADDEIIFSSDGIDPNYILKNVSLDIKVNAAGSFEFTISPSHPFYNKVKLLSTIIKVEKNGEPYWEGRALTEEYDFYNNKKIYCEGDLSYLNDVILLQNDYTYMSASNIFYLILRYYNKKVAIDKQFKIGSCPDIYIDSVFYTDYNNVLSTLTSLCELINGVLYIERKGDKKYLHIYSRDDAYISSDQTINFGTNLMKYARTYDGNDVATVIIPLGEKGETEEFEDQTNLIENVLTNVIGTCDSDGKNFVINQSSNPNFKGGYFGNLIAGNKYRIISSLPKGNKYANFAIYYKDGPPIGEPTGDGEGYSIVDEEFTATSLMGGIYIFSDTQTYNPAIYLISEEHEYNGYTPSTILYPSSTETMAHYCKEYYYEKENDEWVKKSRVAKVNYYPLDESTVNDIITKKKELDNKNNDISDKEAQIEAQNIVIDEKYAEWQADPENEEKKEAYNQAVITRDGYLDELEVLKSEKEAIEKEIENLEKKDNLDTTFQIHTFNLSSDGKEKRYFINNSVMTNHNFYMYVLFLADGSIYSVSDISEGNTGQTTYSYTFIEVPSFITTMKIMHLNRQSSFSLYNAIEAESDNVTYSDRLTIASVNNDSIYLEAPERERENVDISGNVTIEKINPLKEYGRIEKIYELETDDPTYLKEQAQLYLEDYQFDNMVITVEAIDLIALGNETNSFDIYQKVTVISPIHGLNKSLPIDEMSIDITNPAFSKITLNSAQTNISLTSNY